MSKRTIVLNNIGGGFDILVKRLPLPEETVMMKRMYISQDLAKGGNVAYALGRLDVPVSIIGKVGDDEAGHRDLEWMSKAGVDISHVIVDKNAVTGQGIGIVDENGISMLITGESSSKFLRLEEVYRELDSIDDGEWFVSGLEIEPALAMGGMLRAKELGFKVAFNPSPVPDNWEIRDLSFVDALFVNELESFQILGKEFCEGINMHEQAREILSLYKCGMVVITLGKKGCIVLSENRLVSCPSPEVEAVDTCGAGDGFMSAFLAELLNNRSIEDACRFAAAYAAYSVSIREVLPSYADRATIEAFINSNSED